MPKNIESQKKPDLRATILATPYPYKRLCAIESDIDGANLSNTMYLFDYISHLDWDEPWINKFSNSIWMFNNRNSQNGLSFFNGIEPNADPVSYWDLLVELNKLGLFSTLHSFGSFKENFTRAAAERAQNWCVKNSVKFDIFSNHGGYHGQNVMGKRHISNVTTDTPNTREYAADIIKGMGVQFYWIGGRYSTDFGRQQPLETTTLRDGSVVQEFFRYSLGLTKEEAIAQPISMGAQRLKRLKENNNFFQFMGWNPPLIEYQFSASMIKEADVPYIIFGQHLNNIGEASTISPEVARCLKMLCALENSKDILLVRTSDLLSYYNLQRSSKVNIQEKGGTYEIKATLANYTEENFRIMRSGLPLSLVLDKPNKGKRLLVFVNGKQLNPQDFNSYWIDEQKQLVINILGEAARRKDDSDAARRFLTKHLNRAVARQNKKVRRRVEGELASWYSKRLKLHLFLQKIINPTSIFNAETCVEPTSGLTKKVSTSDQWKSLLKDLTKGLSPRKVFIAEDILKKNIGCEAEVNAEVHPGLQDLGVVPASLMLYQEGLRYVSQLSFDGAIYYQFKRVPKNDKTDASSASDAKPIIELLKHFNISNWSA